MADINVNFGGPPRRRRRRRRALGLGGGLVALVVAAILALSGKGRAPAADGPRLPAADVALGRLRAFAPGLVQIPAAVVDQGPLRRVPYLSYRDGELEFNAYGDPERPACLEIGVFGDPARRPAARDALAALVGADLKELDLAKDKRSRGGLTFEVTPPEAPDAYGGWWVSVYSEPALEASRASDAELKDVAAPRGAEDVRGRPGKTVYVKGYRRKDGRFVPGYTKQLK